MDSNLGERLLLCIAMAGALVLFACSDRLAEIAYMPPDAFLHPFAGTVMVTAQDPRSIHLSQAETKPTLGLCWIRLPVSESRKMRECLFLIEMGGCNGATDVNADPQRKVIPAGYERTCAARDWSPEYQRLAQTAKWVGIAP